MTVGPEAAAELVGRAVGAALVPTVLAQLGVTAAVKGYRRHGRLKGFRLGWLFGGTWLFITAVLVGSGRTFERFAYGLAMVVLVAGLLMGLSARLTSKPGNQETSSR